MASSSGKDVSGINSTDSPHQESMLCFDPTRSAYCAVPGNAADIAVEHPGYTATPTGAPDQLKMHWSSLTFSQHSRRYLGNKYKLVNFIRDVVAAKCPDCRSVADVFAGTGVVGAAFNSPDRRIIVNDLLYSNYVCLYTFLGVKEERHDRLAGLIDYLNCLPGDEPNYFSEHFGDRYFTQRNAQKIGAIRIAIDQIATDEIERNMLLCSLIYAVDKVANTVGHYDAFRKRMDMVQPVRLAVPSINATGNDLNQIYCTDANELVRRIDCDMLYLDPPYNSRQYSDAYHVLENLTAWSKPAVKGIGRKMDRAHIKSRYCINGAAGALADLIEQASCRHVLLSYNNTGNSLDGRSNARITDAEIMDILEAKGEVEVFSKQHKAFTTGKNIADDNAERLFYCCVRRDA